MTILGCYTANAYIDSALNLLCGKRSQPHYEQYNRQAKQMKCSTGLETAAEKPPIGDRQSRSDLLAEARRP